ncbi:hypothetical protein [Agromyces sp. SYSU T00194]|uniref:hypothetical protein n=1 Tax=Agromyces chitinivorans TaxID=3158560 RepID=UPI0033960030
MTSPGPGAGGRADAPADPLVGPERRAHRATRIGIAIAAALVAASVLVPLAVDWNVHVKGGPPLHGFWDPRFGAGTAPAIAIAVLALVFAAPVAARLRWGWLLLAAWATGAAWLASLALVDGFDGIAAVLDADIEYLPTAREVTDLPATLEEFIERIPRDHPDNWPIHVAGHPAGALAFFVGLTRIGLGSGAAAGWLVLLLAATIPVAVLLAMRRFGAEDAARRAAPFLVLGPSAIWMAVSGDALFAVFTTWGLCLLAFATRAASRTATAAWAIGAGLLLGSGVLLSYGLVLMGLLAVAVLVIGRNWRPLPWAAGAALVPVLVFAAFGFAWWEAYPVLVDRYWDGIASRRPAAYWIWGDLAALVCSAGLAAGASVALALVRLREWRRWSRPVEVVVVLTLAAAATVLLADLSQMSKAEVERIWLPFVPWLLVGTALLPRGAVRPVLFLQLALAIALQHLYFFQW